MTTDNGLSIIDLACIRANKVLFSHLSFSLPEGTTLFIEGANGAGKSSLLRLLTGLATPAFGNIFWRGQTLSSCREKYWEEMHYISHANGIKHGLTVLENLQLASSLSLKPLGSAYTNVLDNLQLSSHEKTLAGYLSAGQKRRLALARLFLFSKPLWLLDEPLTALDLATQAFFLSQLNLHIQQGGICIMSSHQAITLEATTNIQYLRLPT